MYTRYTAEITYPVWIDHRIEILQTYQEIGSLQKSVSVYYIKMKHFFSFIEHSWFRPTGKATKLELRMFYDLRATFALYNYCRCISTATCSYKECFLFIFFALLLFSPHNNESVWNFWACKVNTVYSDFFPLFLFSWQWHLQSLCGCFLSPLFLSLLSFII